MIDEWAALQDEYDDLLMKNDKTPEIKRRINEIESAIIRRFGLDSQLFRDQWED